MFLSYIKLFDSHPTWYLRHFGTKTWIFKKWIIAKNWKNSPDPKEIPLTFANMYCNHSQPFTSYAKLFDSHLTWYVRKFWGKNVNFLKINNCWKLEKLSKFDKYTTVICKHVYCIHLQRFHHISSCLTFIQSVIWEILGQKREIRIKKILLKTG
jgi:hypothetical protein